jgi:hypothetical protein
MGFKQTFLGDWEEGSTDDLVRAMAGSSEPVNLNVGGMVAAKKDVIRRKHQPQKITQ